MKARKKPVVVEVFKTGLRTSKADVERFCEGNVIIGDEPDALWIRTLEGNMKVTMGDYIIKGVNGEFYPCKPEIFEKTYEIVDEDDSTVTVDLDPESVLVNLSLNDIPLGKSTFRDAIIRK